MLSENYVLLYALGSSFRVCAPKITNSTVYLFTSELFYFFFIKKKNVIFHKQGEDKYSFSKMEVLTRNKFRNWLGVEGIKQIIIKTEIRNCCLVH